MFLKPLKVYHSKLCQALIPVGRDDEKGTTTIRRISFSLYKFCSNQARNEFCGAVIPNHKLLGQIADTDIAFWIERLDDQERLVPLHCEAELG